jgi:ribose 5-phosphate isomerase B
MIVEIGADHRGYELKGRLIAWLAMHGHDARDHGCKGSEPCDYPDFAYAAARAVAKRRDGRGVVICGSGIGVSMTANKVRGVRAALCLTVEMARQSRRHNDSNVLALPADSVTAEEAARILDAWLTTEFEGGRHARRLEKLMAGECRAPSAE